MTIHYLTTMLTPAVRAAEAKAYGQSYELPKDPGPDALGPEETEFIRTRDSFYLATVNEDGWPYIQHRGGPPGFLKVLDAHTLGFSDLRGNRQLITAGNLAGSDKVSLFLMDYPGRTRLKILGRARVVGVGEQPELAARLSPGAKGAKVERLFVIDVAGLDWNCPAHITPRYTEAEIRAAVAAGSRNFGLEPAR